MPDKCLSSAFMFSFVSSIQGAFGESKIEMDRVRVKPSPWPGPQSSSFDLFLGLFQEVKQRKLHFITMQTVVSLSFVWRAEDTRLTFLYQLTIEAAEAFHLWSSCGTTGELGLITAAASVYLYSGSNQKQPVCRPYVFFLGARPPHYNFHRHFVCKCSNRHIHHIKRDSIFFSIRRCMNSATSSVANNKGPLWRAKGRCCLL